MNAKVHICAVIYEHHYNLQLQINTMNPIGTLYKHITASSLKFTLIDFNVAKRDLLS